VIQIVLLLYEAEARGHRAHQPTGAPYY